MSCSQKQEMWEPTGGATDSIYKKSERFLLSNTKVQAALERLSDDDETNPEDYQSMMDYIVCAIFPEIKEPCFAYYRGEGPRMRDLISPGQIDQLDRLILTVLKLVTLLEESNSSASWGDIRQQIIKYFATKRITAPTGSDWAAAGAMIRDYVLLGRRDEDEDDHARRRARVVHEDRPGRRARDDEDEDEGPGRRARDDEDEDEGPGRRARDDEDEDED